MAAEVSLWEQGHETYYSTRTRAVEPHEYDEMIRNLVQPFGVHGGPCRAIGGHPMPTPTRQTFYVICAGYRRRTGPHWFTTAGTVTTIRSKRGIRAQLPKRVWKTKKNRGRPMKKVVPRFQAERTFAWFQKKYRRLVVRWERLAACFDAFLAVATIHMWIHRLIVG